MEIDRANPEVANNVFQKLLPNKSDKKVILEFLANSIEIAHSISPSCWGITLNKNFVRLNVGNIEVIYIAEIFRCILDHDAIPSNLWDDEIVVLGKNEHDPEAGFYKSVPNSVACNMFIEDAKVVLPQIDESHRILVENAAQTGRHAMTKKAHSPAVIDYLASFLDRRIPKPEY